VGLLGQHGRFPTTTVAEIGACFTVIGGQVAFAAGLLALLGIWSRGSGDDRELARTEARILNRRIGVAMLSGLVALVGLALLGIARPSLGTSAWTTFTVVAAGVGAAGLLAAVPTLAAALAVRPAAQAPAGDIFDDLGPLAPSGLRGHPWRLAVTVAGVLAVAVAILGALQNDPYDGVFRGLLEGAMCLGGFTLLGPYLGLWAWRAQSPPRG
jgi:hypothetical protein